MMTSNRPLEDWGKLIGDVPAATAVLDRFLQDAEVIQIIGRNYRLRGESADEKKASSKPAKPANRLRLDKAEEIKRLTTTITPKLAQADPRMTGRS
jgi:hypothetical protein